jgi:Carboxypeptidase regulatory-like domain/TonB dependent receptor
MKRTLLLALLVMTCTAPGWSQSQATTGVIQGTITDPSGAAVAGASVEAKNLDTNFTRSQDSDSGGRFAFLQMPPGRYTVTASKSGFATVRGNVDLTVGQALSLPIALRVSGVSEEITVEAAPTEVTAVASSTTLNELTVDTTPVLGRKFEDLLSLTPGVGIVQGADGDEINFAGQRGVFNNISLDGGDYNNGFFGEQVGGQRAAVDISMEAVREFQVVATGASAEFGRTAGGVVNVITKSGTNDVHGSLFHYQRLEGLTANTSDGKPLQDFHREQSGGSIGGPIVRDKAFFFGSFEQIFENLRRDNLSNSIGTPCSISAPVVGTNDAVIAGSADCQRVALINFFKTRFNQDEGQPVTRSVRNSAALGRVDWNLTPKNSMGVSYNFDYSKNTNQTFDVPTYGNSANGIEGPSKINVVNGNLFTTISQSKLNEFHMSYSRENRPRNAVPSKVPDTAMGFATTFRFGQPYFLEPSIDELFWRTDLSDKFSIIHGGHNIKFGGGWVHSVNTQVFRGFFTGKYIFSDVVGFLHYASPASLGPGYGPRAAVCANGTWINFGQTCSDGSALNTPMLLYLQHAALSGPTTDAAGASSIKNEDYGLFLQDSWKATKTLTINYGLRWEAQMFPDPTLDPAKTAYGPYLSNPLFPSDGTIHDQKKMFQPRIGFAWDASGDGKSVWRASWGIYNARQNMLTQVGAITTNGIQQQSIAAGPTPGGFFNTAGGDLPTYPGVVVPPAIPAGTLPVGAGVTVFSKNYANPRIYTTNTAFEQRVAQNVIAYVDFTWAKGVHLTRFTNPNANSSLFKNLGDVTNTESSAKSLYRGVTFGVRKRFSQRFKLEGNYTYSQDWDDDSNERDPFTFRYFDLNRLYLEYAPSDRDERHKFNFFSYWDLGKSFIASIRMQAHSAQPISPATRKGADRNSLRKDNEFFSFDWRLQRPFKLSERFAIVPQIEMFNTFNNRNNVNPLITPGLFAFDGFLRQGVGDPRTVQLSAKFTF